MQDAKNVIQAAYDRGGAAHTKVVVAQAGLQRAFGNDKLALEILQQHNPAENQQKDYLFTLGDVLMSLKQPEDARAAFVKLVSLHPEVPDFSVALSNCLMQLSEEEEAIAVLRKSIAGYPEQFVADIALSKLYQKQWQQHHVHWGNEGCI